MILRLAPVLILLSGCSPTPALPPDSAGWKMNQISLTGEWYPAVSLAGAAESLELLLETRSLGLPPGQTIRLFIEDLVPEIIIPTHRAAFDLVLDEIVNRANTVAGRNGLKIVRERGDIGAIPSSAGIDPKLKVTTRLHDNAVVTITITNMVVAPFSWITYSKTFRGSLLFHDESPFP